jgi:L-ascorbate metabolism protein UlaG (beta-lactamase superfamily)
MRIRYLGGPTAILEIGGVRLLTDPTYDPPGEYPIGERVLTKTQGRAIAAGEVGAVDAVLLSDDQLAIYDDPEPGGSTRRLSIEGGIREPILE